MNCGAIFLYHLSDFHFSTNPILSHLDHNPQLPRTTSNNVIRRAPSTVSHVTLPHTSYAPPSSRVKKKTKQNPIVINATLTPHQQSPTRLHRPQLPGRDHQRPYRLPRIHRRQMGRPLLAPRRLHTRLHNRAGRLRKARARIHETRRQAHRPERQHDRVARRMGTFSLCTGSTTPSAISALSRNTFFELTIFADFPSCRAIDQRHRRNLPNLAQIPHHRGQAAQSRLPV